MKYYFVILLIVICSNNFGQTSGYFGKKNLLDIGIKFSNPTLYKLKNYGTTYYKASGNRLVQSRDRIDYAFIYNYSRILSDKLCLALEVDIEKFKHELYYNGNSIYNYSGNIERLEFTSRIIMPKIQFNTKNSFFPVGTYHEFGFGFRTTKLVKKDYLFDLEKVNEDYDFLFENPQSYMLPLTPEEEAEIKNNFYNYTKNSFKGYVIYYSFNMRKPISKYILLNYGFAYTLNIAQKEYREHYDQSNSYLISAYDVQEMIRLKKRYNLIQFKIGLTLALF